MRFTKAQVTEAKEKAVAKAVCRSSFRSFVYFILGCAIGAAAMGSYFRPDIVKNYSQQAWNFVTSIKNADIEIRVNSSDVKASPPASQPASQTVN